MINAFAGKLNRHQHYHAWSDLLSDVRSESICRRMMDVGMMYIYGMMSSGVVYVGMLARDSSGRFARLGHQVPTATAGVVTGQQVTAEGAPEASEANTDSSSQDAMPVKQQGGDSSQEDKMQVDQQERDSIKSERQGQVNMSFALHAAFSCWHVRQFCARFVHQASLHRHHRYKLHAYIKHNSIAAVMFESCTFLLAAVTSWV